VDVVNNRVWSQVHAFGFASAVVDGTAAPNTTLTYNDLFPGNAQVNLATNTVSDTVSLSSPVTYAGIQTLNVQAAGGVATVLGPNTSSLLTYIPTAPGAATLTESV